MLLLELIPGDACHPDELLQTRLGADRNHHAAADGELIAELLRHVRPARRHDDGIVRGVLRPAEAPVAMQHLDVLVPERPEAAARQLDQRHVPLHRPAGKVRPGAGVGIE